MVSGPFQFQNYARQMGQFLNLALILFTRRNSFVNCSPWPLIPSSAHFSGPLSFLVISDGGVSEHGLLGAVEHLKPCLLSMEGRDLS